MSSAASAPEVNAPSSFKRKSDDIGWKYGYLADPNNPTKVTCKRCKKEVNGGIYRLKQHVARIGNIVENACKLQRKRRLNVPKPFNLHRTRRRPNELIMISKLHWLDRSSGKQYKRTKNGRHLQTDVLRRRRSRKGDAGFSLTFAAFAGLIGVLVGLMMSLIFSSQPATA